MIWLLNFDDRKMCVRLWSSREILMKSLEIMAQDWTEVKIPVHLHQSINMEKDQSRNIAVIPNVHHQVFHTAAGLYWKRIQQASDRRTHRSIHMTPSAMQPRQTKFLRIQSNAKVILEFLDLWISDKKWLLLGWGPTEFVRKSLKIGDLEMIVIYIQDEAPPTGGVVSIIA